MASRVHFCAELDHLFRRAWSMVYQWWIERVFFLSFYGSFRGLRQVELCSVFEEQID